MIDLKPKSNIQIITTKLYPLGKPKQCVFYEGHCWLMKLPDNVDVLCKRLLIEHLASQIFAVTSTPVQQTQLINKQDVGVVLLCSDFTDGYPLYSIAQFFDTVIKDSVKYNTITEFFTSLKMLAEDYPKLPYNAIENRFWSMFVLDAFVNNTQRSLDDWGIIVTDDEYYIAPVYGLSKAFVTVDSPVDEWSSNIYNKLPPTRMMNPFEYIKNNLATNMHLLHGVYNIIEHSVDDYIRPIHEMVTAFPEYFEMFEKIEHLIIVNHSKLVDILSNNSEANIHQQRKAKVHQFYENHRVDYSQNEDGFVRICGATPPLLLCKNIGINLSDMYERAYVTLCLSNSITPCSADESKFKVYT